MALKMHYHEALIGTSPFFGNFDNAFTAAFKPPEALSEETAEAHVVEDLVSAITGCLRESGVDVEFSQAALDEIKRATELSKKDREQEEDNKEEL